MSARVTVAVLNHNGKRHLSVYLPELIKYTPLDNIARILIIDNASTDDSLEWLRSTYSKEVDIVTLTENFGFAGGYNLGLKDIQTEFYILLSSDVRVSPNWLSPLIDIMDTNPEVAVCQPKIKSDINPSMFDYSGALGGWIDKLGIPFAVGRIFDYCEEDTHQYDQVQKIAWACGAALMIRSELYHKVDGMDPFFFAHQEEIDMCWRLSSLGYTILNCPSSTVYHLGGGTLHRDNPYKLFLNLRNNLILIYKNVPISARYHIFFFRFLIDYTFAIVELFKGNPGQSFTIMKAYIAFVMWLFFAKKTHPSVSRKYPQHGFYRRLLIYDYYIRRVNLFSKLRFGK